MPKDEETKNTKGYAFVEFNSPEASQQLASYLLRCMMEDCGRSAQLF